MTPVDFVRIPFELLQDPHLCDKQKMLLGLIISFDSKGLMMSNGEIGKLLMLNPDYVSQIISDLETKKYIKITGAQSKYRKIYFEKNLKVKQFYSEVLHPLLLEKPKHTLRKTSNITEGTEKKRRAHTKKQTFVEPTLDEVAKYVSENNLSVRPEKFLKYFTESGWIDGKGQKVTNWKLKLLTWDSFDKRKPGTAGQVGIVQTEDCDPDEAERLRIEKKKAGY